MVTADGDAVVVTAGGGAVVVTSDCAHPPLAASCVPVAHDNDFFDTDSTPLDAYKGLPAASVQVEHLVGWQPTALKTLVASGEAGAPIAPGFVQHLAGSLQLALSTQPLELPGAQLLHNGPRLPVIVG